jgi:protein OS-9
VEPDRGTSCNAGAMAKYVIKPGNLEKSKFRHVSTYVQPQKALTFVQFHCSMTTTDAIILVREAKTCSYVLVVHTPRLCGQPGFKSRRESRDETYIRCREIVDSIEPSTNAENPLMETDRPRNKMAQRQPLLTVPSRPPTDPGDAGSGKGKGQQDYNERLRKILEAVLGSKDNGEFSQVIVEQINIGGDGEEDMVLQFEIDDVALDGHVDEQTGHSGTVQSLLETLRAAGLDVNAEKLDDKKEEEQREEKTADGEQPQARDEL